MPYLGARAGVGELCPESPIIGAELPAVNGALCLGDCEKPFVTGWENERRIFEESLLGAGENEETHRHAVLDSTGSVSGAGDFGTDFAYLSADIAGIIDEDYRPQDGSSMPKQKNKKRALGQKPDERDFEHKM